MYSSHRLSTRLKNGLFVYWPIEEASGVRRSQLHETTGPLDLTDNNTVGAAVAVAAAGTLTVDTQPTAGDTMTIENKTYTFVAGAASADGEISRGASLAAAQTNIVAAINGTDGVNTAHPTVSAGAFAANASIITCLVAGQGGNSVRTTETFTAGTNVFNAATLGTTTLGREGGPSVNLRAAGQFVRINAEYLSSTHTLFALNRDFAVSLWFRFDSDPVSSGLISKWDVGQEAYRIDLNAGPIRWLINPSDDATAIASWTGPMVVGTWYFAYADFVRSRGEARLSINNGAFDSATAASLVNGLKASTAPFLIGALVDGLSGRHDGQIVQVALWRRPLTVAERNWLYNGGRGRRL